jgi:RNA polymerase sigma-54 factor
MAPRLQQQVRLLQLSSLEFMQEIRGMLDVNPFLESPEGDAAEGATEERETWFDVRGSNNRGASSEGGDFDALSAIPDRPSLAEHLHGQLGLLRLDVRELALAHAIVDSLDDDGGLRMPLDEIAPCAGLTPMAGWTEMRIALRRVQSLEPAGVAARSLQECLLLQTREIAEPGLRALAREIIELHLDSLAARQDPAALAKALARPVGEVARACACVRRMNPRPGERFNDAGTRYITPDIIVRKVRGRWSPSLNPAVMPRMNFNQVYADLFETHRTRHDAALADHLRDARWAVRCVQQRFNTILDVAKSIVRRQVGFFEYGEMAIKPMALKDVAQEVGVHESTVSRVTNNKYLSTLQGVFELKHFFSRAMSSTSGSEFSGKAVRELVLDMIRSEPPAAPLSDAEIARQLGRQGLVICRRTVTKYRQQSHIGSASQRRRPSTERMPETPRAG